MFRLFHHHDGFIRIVSDNKVYTDSIENFKVDLSAAMDAEYPGLPDGHVGRYYNPGQSHYLTTGDTARPLQREWPEGDRYIADIERLLAAKEQREKGVKESKEF